MTVRYGLLSTHPPTRCGLATSNAALAAHLTIAGQTHPKVLTRDGDAYRTGLHRLGAQLGIAHAEAPAARVIAAAAIDDRRTTRLAEARW